MLKINDLKVKLGDTVVEIPYLRVEKGDYIAIIGTTGAGKTVLVETIAGFHRVERGEIIMNGEEITTFPPNKRNIAIVYQDFMLFPHMTVQENIFYPLHVKKIKNHSLVNKIISLLKIENLLDRYPKTLSGGEMQRVSLARALATQPEVIFLDEPFSSLDRKTKEVVRRIVKDTVKSFDATVIHITHDVETAWLMANKVAVMHQGKLMQFGDIEDVFFRPNPEFVADFVDTNVLRGEVVGKKEGLVEVAVGNEKIYISESVSGEVLLSIRPENIIVAKNEIESSMRNSLTGRIGKMENHGMVVRLIIDFNGFSLISVLTPNAIHALSIKKGDEVFVYFKAVSVRVL